VARLVSGGEQQRRLLSLPPAVSRRVSDIALLFCVGLHGMPHPSGQDTPSGFFARLAARVPPLLTTGPLARYLPGMFSNTRKFPPNLFAPCLPMTAPRPPSGPLWLHEIKHDGIRVIAQRQGDRVKLYSRHGDDMTKRFPLIVEAMMRLRASSCVIDGEAVLCGDDGIPSFDLLRHKLHEGRGFLYAFDLIELDGEDLRGATLEQRKVSLWRVLKNATVGTTSPGLLINDWIEGAESDGATVFQHACSLGLEGIVSKRKGSRYNSGRSPYWLKLKNPDSPAVRRETEEEWDRRR
jgi:bifunctional non-homologous end joining protein LigD